MSTPELKARVEKILAARAKHREDLAEWHRSSENGPGKATTDEEWKRRLEYAEYEVLRLKGTERKGGEYDDFYPPADAGHFACRGCGKPLYSAESKFKSGCGWPTFDKCFKDAVDVIEDTSHGMMRLEICCSSCAGHLGHVFAGERMTATNERHCVNSPSLLFVKPEGGAPVSSAEESVTSMQKLVQLARSKKLVAS